MKKINIVVFILLISILAGCKDETSQVMLSTESVEEMTEMTEISSEKMIYVYISGEIKHPGVYSVAEGTRLFTVIEQAGGFTKKAQQDYLNQAEPVSDGQSIYVMSKKEYKESNTGDFRVEVDTGSNFSSQDTSGLVNINTASAQELMNLPGIGQTKAIAIIEYRDKNGNFTAIEEIKNVSGIGDSTFTNIEGMITIG